MYLLEINYCRQQYNSFSHFTGNKSRKTVTVLRFKNIVYIFYVSYIFPLEDNNTILRVSSDLSQINSYYTIISDVELFLLNETFS